MGELKRKIKYIGEKRWVEKPGDLLVVCHNPYEHGFLNIVSNKSTIDSDGKEVYEYHTLRDVPYVDPDTGYSWETILKEKRKAKEIDKFKYIWGDTCPIWYGSDFINIFYNIMNNSYEVLQFGGKVILPFYDNILTTDDELRSLFSKKELSKKYSLEIVEHDCMPVWIEVTADKPKAAIFLVFTKLGASGGRRRKTMRKRGRRLTKR